MTEWLGDMPLDEQGLHIFAFTGLSKMDGCNIILNHLHW